MGPAAGKDPEAGKAPEASSLRQPVAAAPLGGVRSHRAPASRHLPGDVACSRLKKERKKEEFNFPEFY